MQDILRKRHIALRSLIDPLPGSVPYLNRRPLNVPGRFDGFTLLNFLIHWHPQIAPELWLRKIECGEVVPAREKNGRKRSRYAVIERVPLSPSRIVRGGERFENLLPKTVEPAVNANLQILFEDDHLIVINKPAPLPLHAAGRFNKNTVQYILSQLYAPHTPLNAHRLDANTSGVLVLCRSPEVARDIQAQFAQRTVRKTYIARVHGHPTESQFECNAKIASAPGPGGVRRIDIQNGQTAQTKFRIIACLPDHSALVEASPVTGRTNQIRLHLWHLGLPIVGDPAYLPAGAVGSNRSLKIDDPPMCLHAHQIALRDPLGVERIFRAPQPNWISTDDAVCISSRNPKTG